MLFSIFLFFVFLVVNQLFSGEYKNKNRSSESTYINSTFSSYQKNNATSTHDEIMYFPYQDEENNYKDACPIYLNDGRLMVLWEYYNDIFYSFSSDTGLNWSEPVVMGYETFSPPTGLQLPDGQILITWWTNEGIKLSMSDESAQNWSEPKIIVERSNNVERYLHLNKTKDGKLWLFYARDDSGYHVFYRTSLDSGINWSEEIQITVNTSLYASVVSIDSTTYLLAYSENSNYDCSIYFKKSYDCGLNWTEPLIFSDTDVFNSRPRFLRQTDGILWMIYISYEYHGLYGYLESNIFYVQSFDSSETWTEPKAFTKYIGLDYYQNVTLTDNNPFVFFTSSRWQNARQLYYGIIGISNDENVPPVVIDKSNSIVNAGGLLYVRAYALDESGLENVLLKYTLNGQNENEVLMHDDGYYSDLLTEDNIYGIGIGPFQVGDTINYSISISDLNSNSITTDTSLVYIEHKNFHNAGNIYLEIGENSRLGNKNSSFGASFTWPDSNSHGYLFLGGLWIGNELSGKKYVMDTHYYDSDWRNLDDSTLIFRKQISDQDGIVIYDDQYADGSPLGLHIQQESYQWSNPEYANFLIFKYSIKNRRFNRDLINVYVALWLDPDISDITSAQDDLTNYDPINNFVYFWDSKYFSNAYFGAKLLDSEEPHTINVYSPNLLYDPNDDEEKYEFMTKGGVTIPSEEADYRAIITAPPFSLSENDEKTITFGLAMGNSLEDLTDNINTMTEVYNSVLTNIDDSIDKNLPNKFFLFQNFPNPFNSNTKLKYSLLQKSHVNISVYDITGQLVKVLINRKVEKGEYEILWDANNLSSGVYFYKLSTDDQIIIRKSLLIK
jgi:hypothetical protein